MTLDQYSKLGKNWSPQYKEGDRPVDCPFGIGWTARPTDRALDRLTAKGIVYIQGELREPELV
jgi:hypothetical protein